MTNIQKLFTVIKSLLSIVAGIFMIVDPEDGYLFMVGILAVWLTIYGLKILIYYVTMARFMVGGKMLLLRGLILFDFGIFTTTLSDVPRIYVLLYLAIIHAFSGFVEVLNSNESRRYGARSWKLKCFHGILNVIIAICCFAYSQKANTVVIIYSTGLIYSAIISAISAFRKTTMVYIQ
jgi:uncharacterized membrane protein HdeD (DUF308 family)